MYVRNETNETKCIQCRNRKPLENYFRISRNIERETSEHTTKMKKRSNAMDKNIL